MRARLTAAGWDTDLAVEPFDGDPLADPQRDHVVARVEACGVCHRDCIDRDGRFPFMRFPITPGHEAVGRVVAAGPDAAWKIGDRVATMHRDACGRCDACAAGETSLCPAAAFVFGILADGGYATHLRAPGSAFFAVPDELPAAEAAVLHCTFGTAYRGLHRGGGVGAGDRVLVTGANGGVGSAAIQVASRLGAEVVAVVRDERHAAWLRELGATEVVVSTDGRFHKKLRAKVDLALDCVGEPTFNASLRSLRLGGLAVAIGNVVPARVEINLGYAITSALRIAGSSGATRTDMAAVIALHGERPFDVAIERTHPLAEADRAQRAVRAGGLRGRIVLEMPRSS